MPATDPSHRPARPDDADVLVELINYAAEGLPLHLWGKMAEPGESAWEVGRRRARRDEGGFSYRNAVILEEGGERVACLIGYKLPDEPVTIDTNDMSALFASLQELENLAAGTWYINVLATFPAWRNRGHGTRLLSIAERTARELGTPGLSLIVSDANTGARRLYERTGFSLRASRPMVKEEWQSPGENSLLLVKEF